MNITKLQEDNPFRNANNQRIGRALFLETSLEPDRVLYTLKNHDHQGFPSIHRLYLEENDPTEYRVANKYFEDWDHWESLCNSSFFKPYVEKMRAELEIRYRSESLANIIETANKGGRDSFQASKYIAEKGWEKPKPGQKGRPSKEAIAREAHSIASERNRLEDDFERIMGKPN